LSVFNDIYWATQQKTYEEGVESGTRRRRPGGGSKGKLPTMAEKLHNWLQVSGTAERGLSQQAIFASHFS
jgi:hypothetical protein